ncbi:MAG: hypothetical protein K0S07_1641 [Chlamydiales bacterium]|jgi:hypothetical protein|nr:hypothetical protein [Chlamydiales bacterium]
MIEKAQESLHIQRLREKLGERLEKTSKISSSSIEKAKKLIKRSLERREDALSLKKHVASCDYPPVSASIMQQREKLAQELSSPSALTGRASS